MHMPSVFWMVVCACVTLASSVYYAAGRNNKDGLQICAAALLAHGAAYALFVLRGQIPDLFSIIIANGLISLSYSLFLWAILKFLCRPIDYFLLVAPTIMMMVLYYFVMPNYTIRVMAGNGIFAAQCLVICFYLIGHRFTFSHRGRNMILFSMGCLTAIFVWRIGTALFNPQNLAAHFQTNLVQTTTFITVLVAMLLVSNGFVLMVKERSEHQLRCAAMKDPLTGCWNTIGIAEVAEKERMRLARYGHPVALLLADIEDLKSINRQFGHRAGDDTILAFTKVVREMLRATDIIGRVKGGTFSIILPSTGFTDAAMLADKLRLGFADRKLPFGYHATVSLGVAICRSVDTWDLWYDRAETALNTAKLSGNNRIAIENFDNILTGGAQDVCHMMQLRWSKSYETGIGNIDAQHQAIFEKANMLFLLGASESNKEAVLALLEPLLTEVRDHLADEEFLLQMVENYAVQNHIRMHYYLLKRLEDLKNLFRASKIDTAELFHFLMFEYIIQHILIEDLKIFSEISLDLNAAQRAADQAVYPPSRLTALS